MAVKKEGKVKMNHISYFFFIGLEHHGTIPPSTSSKTHPIQHAGPSLHCDALEDSQHGKQDIIKRGNSIVRSLGSMR